MGLYLCLDKKEDELFCPICSEEMGAYIPGGSQTKSFNDGVREKKNGEMVTKKEVLELVKSKKVEFISQCSDCKIGVEIIFSNNYSEEL